VIADMSILQRGHFKTESCAAVGIAAAAPQWGQCLLPMNINPKQAEHDAVASFDSQYLHREESELIAAPQLGQLRVWASMLFVAPAGSLRDIFSLTFQPSTVNGKRCWGKSVLVVETFVWHKFSDNMERAFP
jgi:hypothetical protein